MRQVALLSVLAAALLAAAGCGGGGNTGGHQGGESPGEGGLRRLAPLGNAESAGELPDGRERDSTRKQSTQGPTEVVEGYCDG